MIVQLSTDLFWGYRCQVNMSSFASSQELVEHVKQELIAFLLTGNLQILAEQAKQLKLHHCADWMSKDDSEIVYLCDVEHS